MPSSPLIVSTVRQAAGVTTQLLGLAALAALLAAGAAALSRYGTDQRIPQWLAVLVGLVPVVVYLGTTPALESVLREGLDPTEIEVGLFNLGGVLAGAGGSIAGRRVGDQFCTEVLFWSPTQDADEEVGQLAQTVGQVTTVRLPAEIDDAIGYDPIPERTKEALAGTSFVFPRTLTTAELSERLAARLKSDYGVETVDAEFDGDRLTYLAVGRRAAGIGSTLPAATNAVAVRADPAFSASTGDIVQVWDPDSMRRVLTGELRGVADDVVTVAIDATDTPKVDPRKRYRLVTLPVEDRPDREFASLLRAAPETFSSATVEAGSPLHGLPVGALDLTVVAVRPEETEPVVFPEGNYRLAPGDRLFVVGTASALRYLARAGEALDPSLAGPPPSMPADDTPAEGIETAAVSGAEPDDQPDEPARIGGDGIETEGQSPVDAGQSQPADASAADGQPVDGKPADSQPVDAGATDSPSPAAQSEADSQITGKADETTFEEIKAEFDEGSDDEQFDEAGGEDDGEPVEAAASSPGETAESDLDQSGASFEDLRDEFESGEADWDDDEDEEDPFEDVEIAFEDEGADEDGDEDADDDGDELVSLDEADISFEDEADEEPDDEETDDQRVLGDPEIDEDLQGDDDDSLAGDLTDLGVEESTASETTDDLSDLDFEEDDEDGLFADDSLEDDDVFGDDSSSADDGAFGDDSLEDDDVFGDDEDEDDDDGASEDDDDDDDDGGGGGKSFAELKDEFESGDADWEDDVSDSPGGDMRLDE